MSKTCGNCPTLVIARALNPGGIGLVHTIGCSEARNEHDLFIQKYIFWVLNQPRLSEIAASMERQGLAILDVENIVRDYSYTVLGWLKRFDENRSRLDATRMMRSSRECGNIISPAVSRPRALPRAPFSRSAFQHVRQNKAGMAVCLANPSGRHINFTHRQKFLLTTEIRTCSSGDVIASSRFEIPIWLIDRAGF